MDSPSLWHVLHRNGMPCKRSRCSVQTALRCPRGLYSAGACLRCPLQRLLLPGRVQTHNVMFPDLLETLHIPEGEVQDMDVMRDGHFGQFHQHTLIEST